MKTPNIEKYNLIRRLASGGQGDVYLARQTNDDLGLDKFIAIKFIQKEFCSKEFFKNEVKLLSQLNHPNICKILDVGENKECFYIVMEFIEGINLKELTNLSMQKGISIPDALIFEIGKSIFEALVYAHHHSSGKILHKDISPHNIMIGKNGSVILIDFGISELFAEENTHYKNGKPTYIPDNVLNGVKKYDETIDMYSLGVVLYELASSLKVKTEKEINLELVSNNVIRNIISSLLKFTEAYDVFNKSNFISSGTSKESILKTISKLVDEKVISENTIVSNSRSSYSHKFKLKYTILITLVVFISIIFTLKISAKQFGQKISEIQIKINNHTEQLLIPRTLFKSDIPDPLNMNTESCEMHCSAAVTYMIQGHKDFYKYVNEKNMNQQDFKNNYPKYLNHSLLLYKKSSSSLFTNLHRCEMKENCRDALEIANTMSQSIPLNVDGITLKANYDSIMNGSDSSFNTTVNSLILNPMLSDNLMREFPTSTRFSAITPTYTIYQTEDDLDEKACKKIGDWEFLDRTMIITNLTEASMNTSLNLLIFNSRMTVLKTNDSTLLDFDSNKKETNKEKLKVCLYVRENGILKQLLTWEY